MFFDSHCHLSDERLFSQLENVCDRARAAEVNHILSISVDLDDCAKILDFANGETIWASAGVHPASALVWNEESGSLLENLIQNPFVVAVGECGLDYLYDEKHPHYPGATRTRQAEVFEAQLEIAARLQKPIVIHNREADDDLIAIIRNWRHRLVGGVFHCFGSSPEVAKAVLELDFHLGFTGIVTFKNAPELQEIARWCPLDRMLIETDAPYLSPVPKRGKTNEPSFVLFVAAKIGELKGKSREEIGAITTANALKLFSIMS